MPGVERRLRDLERRLGPLRPLPATIDNLALSAIGDLALDALEAVARAWPSEQLPAGLCAAVVAACARPPAERMMALGMASPGTGPRGGPLPVTAALVSSGLLPGAAGDHGALR